MPKKMQKKGNPSVHKELGAFDIKISSFGELEANYHIDSLNDFLNEKVDDKKLNERDKSEEE
jgi:hypothetical protein